jgi:hypothetical protein
MVPVYEIDCAGVTTPDKLWRRYLAVVPAQDAQSFGYTLDSFWDAVQWQGPGWPGECELVFKNTEALSELRTLGGKPFLEAFRRLVHDTSRISIKLA